MKDAARVVEVIEILTAESLQEVRIALEPDRDWRDPDDPDRDIDPAGLPPVALAGGGAAAVGDHILIEDGRARRITPAKLAAEWLYMANARRPPGVTP